MNPAQARYLLNILSPATNSNTNTIENETIIRVVKYGSRLKMYFTEELEDTSIIEKIALRITRTISVAPVFNFFNPI